MAKEYKPTAPDRKSVVGSGGADRLPERDGRGVREQRASSARQLLHESMRLDPDTNREKDSEN